MSNLLESNKNLHHSLNNLQKLFHLSLVSFWWTEILSSSLDSSLFVILPLPLISLYLNFSPPLISKGWYYMSKVSVLASSTAFLLSQLTSLYLLQHFYTSIISLHFLFNQTNARKFYLAFLQFSLLKKIIHFQLIILSIPFSIQTHQVSLFQA